MSEMIERAAAPIIDFARKYWAEAVGDESERVARAALLAALDPEDEALVGLLRDTIDRVGGCHAPEDGPCPYCATGNADSCAGQARASLQTLREHILAGTVLDEPTEKK